jgi:hypothetical protein
MKRAAVLGLVLPATLVTSVALADDKAACLDAASKGQTLRNAHKLVESREQLRICAAAACPAVVQSDCANWLADVEKALPSVVLTAKNAAGASLVDVKVTVDGQPLLTKLDGQAVPTNAGQHTFHFEGVDGSADQQVLVTEGEKNQRIAAVLGAAAPAVAGGISADTGGSSSPWKTVGWVLGGAGVVGLGLGTVFGVMAMSDDSSAHCNASNQCQPGPLSSARSAALVADIGFIAGGVLLAGGAGLVLFGPSGGSAEAPAASATLVPVVRTDGGGAAIRGSW